jgi:hypothetical protein
LASILLSCNTDQTFIKAHFRPRKILGLFMYTTVPCPLLGFPDQIAKISTTENKTINLEV